MKYLLDLFSGAGGCGVGYHRAGFEITGIDNKWQKRYPFNFIQADALEYLEKYGNRYDVIHASPPCQAYSIANNIHKREYPELIEPLRELLIATGKPYIIENVIGAPLNNTIMLCGTMFGLKVIRHRLFESNLDLYCDLMCDHRGKVNPRGTRSSFETGDYIIVAGHNFIAKDAKIAMGIDWMVREELREAIPPAYTEYIGKQLWKIL